MASNCSLLSAISDEYECTTYATEIFKVLECHGFHLSLHPFLLSCLASLGGLGTTSQVRLLSESNVKGFVMITNRSGVILIMSNVSSNVRLDQKKYMKVERKCGNFPFPLTWSKPDKSKCSRPKVIESWERAQIMRLQDGPPTKYEDLCTLRSV
ncbi:hypothetical protein V6N13_109876 [Hibiscus sabdariffa]|uniref:Uncharacterized protein n=1 Tax=Hibiscus sabdariffa TaxID=183260 RepID=A0ABR2FQU1_9ROSI